MDDKALFPLVTEQRKRDLIRRNICDISGLIPSLHTFFESLKYLEPCCKILRDIIPPKSKRTIRQELFGNFYRQPELWIEHDESDRRFQSPISLEVDRKLGYWQLWLYTMRHFPELTSSTPRKELKKSKPQPKQPSPAFEQRFAELAFQTGFQTPMVKERHKHEAEADLALRFVTECGGSAAVCKDELRAMVSLARTILTKASRPGRVESPTDNGTVVVPKDRRIGRPFESTYIHDKKFLFLPCLRPAPSETEVEPPSNITTFFATKDMFFNFFGISADEVRSC